VAKFPHGAVIHALQWLPLLAWAARWSGVAEPRRLRLVSAATAGTAILGGYSLLQTLAGRPRFAAPPAMAALLALGVACLAVPVVMVGVAAIGGRGSQTEASSGRGG
jgi:hypothetical protein